MTVSSCQIKTIQIGRWLTVQGTLRKIEVFAENSANSSDSAAIRAQFLQDQCSLLAAVAAMKKTAAVAVVDCSSLMITGRKIPKLAQMAAISSMSDMHFVPFVFCSSGAGGALLQRLLQKGYRRWLSAVREMQDFR